MRDYDYIVLVDENGQPYIAHGLFGNVKKAVKSAGSRAHKYIAKWGEGAKARYFYTQEELKAAMNQGRQKVKDAANKVKQKGRDAIGITAKEKMKVDRAEYAATKADDAKSYANWNADKAKAEAARVRAEVDRDRSELNKAENRYRQQHEKYYGDENSLGKTVERAVSKTAREEHAADKEKLDELNTARNDAYKTAKAGEQALQEAYDNQRRAMSEKRMADKEADKADRDYHDAVRAYANTPLAKIEAAKDKVSDAIGNAKDKVSDVVGDVKDKVQDIRNKHTEIVPYADGKPPIISPSRADRIKSTVGEAAEKVKDAASGVADAAKGASAKVKSAYDRMREEFAKKREEKEEKRDKDTAEKLMVQYVQSRNNVPSDHDKPKNDPKIDVSKLADNEYVYALGSNTGHAGEVKKVKDAERAYNTAMRNYNRIAASKNASGQDKNAAKREMENMKRDYESLLNDLVDTLNKE